MTRRDFGVLAAAAAGAGVARAQHGEAQALPLGPSGWMPNNAHLPVILYRGAMPAGSAPELYERTFAEHGWPPQWRNGVYTFHHYHSTAHEVLAFAAGEARLVLGGPGGHELTVRAGDIALLPTGTGHCELSHSPDFLVIGAYPEGQTWDICRAAPDAQAAERMRTLPFPQSDPVHGTAAGAPLLSLWTPVRA